MRATRRTITLGLGAAILAAPACAQQPAAIAPTIPLWPNGAPAGPLVWNKPETDASQPPFGRIVRNVAQPSLEVFLPDPKAARGAAVIVAPGGGFHMLSIESEGRAVARWLNSLGIAAFVLKYRLLPTGDEFPMSLIRVLQNPAGLPQAIAPLRPLATADGEQAVRLVRSRAREWGLKPDRIGMMGFSAGGAVTVWTILAQHADSRPDLAMTIYPGALPAEITAPADAPPLFALVAEDDRLAVGDTRRLAAAWTARGLPVELTTYPSGGHGFGMNKAGKPTDEWTVKAEAWLRARGWLAK